MAKKQNNQIIIAAIIIAVVILVGGSKGWFQRLGDVYVEDTTIINQLEQQAGTCTLDINPNVITAGGSVTGKIEDSPNTLCIVYANSGTGWTEVARGLTDTYGEISLTNNVDIPGDYEIKGVCGTCTTNSETLIVNPLAEPDVPEVGDIVDTSTGSGTISWGESDISIITLEGWDTGGPYILGARIHRDWWYIDPTKPDCYGPWPEVMTFTLYDSNAMVWQVYDNIPISIEDEVCPVTYHPEVPWVFEVHNGKVNCPIGYTWEVEAYICEEV